MAVIENFNFFVKNLRGFLLIMYTLEQGKVDLFFDRRFEGKIDLTFVQTYFLVSEFFRFLPENSYKFQSLTKSLLSFVMYFFS